MSALFCPKWEQKRTHILRPLAQTHGDASDEELLDYVRGEAARLGMTPNAGEIIGGHFIAVRFGCWKNVVTAAGLVPPKKQKPLPKRQIFKEELRCQARERAYTEQQNSSE